MAHSDLTLSETDRRDRLRLFRSENGGPATFFKLLDRFGTASKALEMLPDLARRGGIRHGIAICPESAAEREMSRLAALGAHLIFDGEAAFPRILRPLRTAPLLIARGRPELLQTPSVAIVGARNASALGRRMARDLAVDLGRNGFTVVSGLARGIDTAAHEAAGPTGTVAVLAGGVDVVYPEENRGLYDRLCQEGCVISEMPAGMQPQASHFPRRNRLISGLAAGVVVVEAAPRSGSLITARVGLEQGREIFAVPGSPFDPRCQGTNGLIRQGATLVESAADILDVLSPAAPRMISEPVKIMPEAARPAEDELARARLAILPALGAAPVTVDEIIRQCQLSPAVVSMVLVELDLAGRLDHHRDNQISLLP
ncbi:MAG: DNA-protecting protein DprA [Telmatospirillum sp.]|nr:DNA-protecting protein DprA [Telmatospirillum sp.]